MAIGLPKPIPEYQFHASRKWRFDYCYTEKMIAIEIDGGVYSQGRHTRGKGYENDIEKYSEAILLGWRVFRFSTGQVKSGYALNIIERAFKQVKHTP